MKLRTTTPASIPLAARIFLVAISILMAIIGPIQMTQKASADQYDDKIAALQQDIARYQAEGQRLNNEAATLQSALAKIANERSAIQAQIDINQTKFNQLEIQIAETEQKIKTNQDALGTTIAKMYVDGKITPIEMLASSKNIGEYLDMQEYRTSVRNELVSAINEIKNLKKTLDANKAEVSKILEDQKVQRDSIVAKENEQSSLLQKTRGDEAGYQQLIAGSQAAIAEARATQAAINANVNRTGGGTIIDGGLLSDYPWNNSNCPMISYFSSGGVSYSYNGYPPYSGQDGRGYGCRQCASYVAWRIAKETNFYPSWGNAQDFYQNAVARYGAGDGKPHAGSIAVMTGATAGNIYFGHVAWVESEPYISNGREVIQVSQYNYDYGAGYGMYSLVEWSVDAFDYYVKIK